MFCLFLWALLLLIRYALYGVRYGKITKVTSLGAMNSLCWNCRGIGNSRTVFALHDYVRRFHPNLVFLSETKIKSRRMEIVKYRLGFSNGLIVPSRGRRGGLALLWSRDTNLEIKSFSDHHIDAVITEPSNGFMWRFTGFYGHPKTHLRDDSWKLLSLLNSQFNIPWFCCGDFNEILFMNEKAGGVPCPQSQMDSFHQIVNLCGFKDLGYCGPDYTWCNMQEGCNRILLRLDRALATSEWLEYFKDMRVHHLVDSTSDHCILLTTSSPFPVCNRKRRFHFEAMWVKRDDCREVIQEAWNSGTFAATPEGVASNLQKCEAALTNWNQNVVGNIQKKIHEKKRALNSLTMEDSGTGGAEINQLRKEINDLLDSEETIWRQRSKVHWYREGDRNTKFFHARASERRKKNSILGIWNDDGFWCESKESIVAAAVSYFEKIYSTSSPSGISEVVDALPCCVTEDMNAELTKVFTRDEVIKALQQLHPTKAPGPDVIINGEACGNVIPSRGIRQGDPLSPYLFLLCAEGFSALIHKAARDNQISGMSIGRGCPKITHLFFADDSLFFCKANEQECQKLVDILNSYEAASGQKINFDKSSVFFSPNTSNERKESILNILGPMEVSRHNKYLGLPTIIGKSKAQVFADLKDRVAKKLAGWKGKLLSIGGREILIKAVAQAVPTYTMSCFQLPKTLCKDLENMMRNFWWGQRGDENKIAWVSWKKMCKSKFHGGMGFRNIQAFNLAMLAKQGWRILSNPNSLMARVFKAKYFPYDDFLNSKKGGSPSYVWRSIHNSLGVIKKGTKWRVGNGRRIHIWDDKWLPTPSSFKVISPHSNFGDYPMVSSLIDNDTRWWKAEVVRSIFLPFEASTILKIPLNYNLPEDSLIWIGNKRGVFTVKSAYHIASSLVDSNEVGECSSPDSRICLWKRIWHQKIPQKLKIFAWRSCINGLPTMLNLNHRGIHCSSFCPICDKSLESTAHALLLCDHAKLTWAKWHNCPVKVTSLPRDFVDVALEFLVKGSPHDLELFFAVAWSIWWNRNQAIHEDSGSPPSQVWDMANRILSEYKDACSLLPLTSAPSLTAWQAPPSGFFKINTDGAASDGSPSCTGVAIRDCRGCLIAALSKLLPSSYSAEFTEALALQDGVLLALELGISHVIVESDALSVIQAINEGVFRGELGHVVQNIKDISSSFSWCSFQHLIRSGNRAAHELARAARDSGVTQVWKGVCPSFVEHIITEEGYS